MARYIDADKIHEFVDAKVAEGKDGWAKGVPYEWAYALTVVDMQPTADVVPKSEVEEWVDKCREWHKVAELKSQCIMELDEGLAKANAEVARLHSILLQFTEIVHKWGAKNNIDTSEISLVPILQEEADSIIKKAKQEVAREIFAEIERFLYLHFRFCKEEIGNDDTEYVKGRLEHNTQMQGLIAELKKKYTE